MQGDFTTRVDRTGQGSYKWDAMYKARPDVTPGVVPLSVADMEFVTAQPIVDAICAYAQNAVLGYTGPTDKFLEACIEWQQRRHGWSPDRAWMAVTPGVVPAIYNCVRTMTDPGDGVIVQTPVYYPFYGAIRDGGRTIVRNPLRIAAGEDGRRRYEMDLDDLAAKAADPHNTMLILCSPHNPTGRVWTREELRAVLDICLANDVIVVSDEIHDDLIMPGHEHTTLGLVATTEELESIVVCTAPSKTFNLAGLEGSVIYLPGEKLRKRYEAGFAGLAVGTNLNCLSYPATIAAYRECEPWLNELIEVVWGNYQLLKSTLEGELPGVEVFPMEGTYLGWVDFGAWGLSRTELDTFMRDEAELFLDEGHLFGDEGEGFQRFNLACPRGVLAEALERLVAAARRRGLAGEEIDR